jgi:guanylate kinase
MIERDELVEWVEYCGNYYGTPKKYVEESLEQGFDIVLEIEVKGAVNIREKYPDSVLIFILPPSVEELARRIKGRGTEDEETIKKRIETAKMEITYIDRYDYIVVNSDIEAAVKDICSIMAAEKLKYGRIPDILNELGIVWQNQIDNCL